MFRPGKGNGIIETEPGKSIYGNYCPAEELEKGDLQILKYLQKYDNQ